MHTGAWATRAIALLTATLAAASAGAALPDWQAAQDRAQAAYAAGRLDDAEQAAREALAHARAGEGANPTYVASSLNTLALVLQARRQVAPAADLLAEALAASETRLGAHLNTASVAWNLGNALEQLQRLPAAEAHYQRCLTITEALPSDADVSALRRKALLAIARLEAHRGEAAQAERTLQRAHADEPGTGPAESASPLQRAESLERKAARFEAQGAMQEAQSALAAALALREAELGPDDPRLVPNLTALARLHGRQAQPHQAIPLRQRAVHLLERGDPRDPSLVEHLNELALWQAGRGAHAEAAALFERAQHVLEAQGQASAPVPDHRLALARIVSSRARTAAALDDGELAQALYRQAARWYAEAGDTPASWLGQADALNGLAAVIYRKRRLREAEPLFVQALGLMERAVGPDDPRLLPLLDNLQALYRTQGKLAAAQPYVQRSQALRDPNRR